EAKAKRARTRWARSALHGAKIERETVGGVREDEKQREPRHSGRERAECKIARRGIEDHSLEPARREDPRNAEEQNRDGARTEELGEERETQCRRDGPIGEELEEGLRVPRRREGRLPDLAERAPTWSLPRDDRDDSRSGELALTPWTERVAAMRTDDRR